MSTSTVDCKFVPSNKTIKSILNKFISTAREEQYFKCKKLTGHKQCNKIFN